MDKIPVSLGAAFSENPNAKYKTNKTSNIPPKRTKIDLVLGFREYIPKSNNV
jgi:hypothetical protein